MPPPLCANRPAPRVRPRLPVRAVLAVANPPGLPRQALRRTAQPATARHRRQSPMPRPRRHAPMVCRMVAALPPWSNGHAMHVPGDMYKLNVKHF